ncbi:MAG: glycosyltransferase family 1 protein [Rhodospirillales bacterium]|nr:MAG: glycosyltransferase family 1 protein [Rhodospirillales bacterium]
MNRQQVLSRLAARGWPVLYSTGRLATWDIGSEAFASAPWFPGFIEDHQVTIDRPARMLLRCMRLPPLESLSFRLHARHLMGFCQKNDDTRRIAIVYNPEFLPYVQALRPIKTIFYIRDAYADEGGWSQKRENELRSLADLADEIVVSAREMSKILPAKHQERVIEIPNGVDYVSFSAGHLTPEPTDLSDVPEPRIGYIGRLNRKVDWNLIRLIAESRPNWSIVFVGPVVEGEMALGGRQKEMDAVRRLKNVHLLGLKQHNQLPAYVNRMNVNIMPYDLINAPWMRSGYPLKLHEYLATGLPVVSAPLSTVLPFASVVAIAHGLDDWLRLLEEAIAGRGAGTPEQRRAVARENTWDARVDRLEQVLAGLL